MSKFYNLSALSAEGENLSFSSLEGYVLLIVNTASKCGFSKQYSGLQKLYEKYEDNKFMILAFPCNQFGSQEPGNQDEILKFCVKNHGNSNSEVDFFNFFIESDCDTLHGLVTGSRPVHCDKDTSP